MAPSFRTPNLLGFVVPPSTSQRRFVHNPPIGILDDLVPLNPVNHRSSHTYLHAASPISPTLQVASSGLGIEALACMLLLALQFGLQPSLTRKYTPKNINKSTVVFTQDAVKFCMAALALSITGMSTVVYQGSFFILCFQR